MPLALLALAAPARAQDEEELAFEEFEEMSLEELLAMPVAVAGSRAASLRESPGVVTMITREEILRSGARDLIDVLRLVPGFAFGVDVENAVSLGFRGNWGHEGKILLLVDGQEFNEDLYSTLQLGNHFPVDVIHTVEIIRGPGSTIYGGYAELAVISITTVGAAQLRGAYGALSYGQARGDFGRRNLSGAWARRLPTLGNLELSINGLVGQGNRGVGDFTDLYGTTYPMKGNARTDPLFVNAALQFRQLTLRLLVDNYRTTSRDGFDAALDRPVRVDFLSVHLDARGTFHPFAGMTVMPRLNYRRQLPWRDTDARSPLHYNKLAERYTARLATAYEFTPQLSVMAGTEGYALRGSLLDTLLTGTQTLFGEGTQVTYYNLAVFSEITFSSVLGNLVAGGRVERHTAAGVAVVPRVTLSKVIDDFHFKLLYGRAFRAPGLENLNLGFDVRPERTTTLEAEIGYQVDRGLFVTANVFDTTIRDTIVFFYEEGAEGYANLGRAGTRGLEASLRASYAWGRVDLSYSSYTARGRNEVASYQVPDRPELLLGMPAHKVTANAELRLTRDLSVAPSAIFLSERFTYSGIDAEENMVLARLPPVFLLNLYFSWRNAGMRGLDVGAGIYNILDSHDPYPQPYDGGHAPYPSLGRELVARISYAFDT
ncbi:MAG: TonB-dependent receptor plug domain-containing protein [Myxococcota bacterium]